MVLKNTNYLILSKRKKNSTFTQFKANKNIGGAKHDKRKKTRNH